jgi:hypothetical protein
MHKGPKQNYLKLEGGIPVDVEEEGFHMDSGL